MVLNRLLNQLLGKDEAEADTGEKSVEAPVIPLNMETFLESHKLEVRPANWTEEMITDFIINNFKFHCWINGPGKCGNTKLRMFLVHYIDFINGKRLGPIPLDKLELLDSNVYRRKAPNLTTRKEYLLEGMYNPIPEVPGETYVSYLPHMGYFLMRSHGEGSSDKLNPDSVLAAYTPLLRHCKNLFPLRHPLDMAISLYHHKESRNGYQKTIEEFYGDEAGQINYRNHLLIWVQLKHYNGLPVKYENWILDPQKQARDIINYLELPYNEEALQYALFESDVKRAREKEEAFRQEGDNYRRARLGTIGQWKTAMTAPTIERLMEITAELGITPDEYVDPELLEASVS